MEAQLNLWEPEVSDCREGWEAVVHVGLRVDHLAVAAELPSDQRVELVALPSWRHSL